MILNTNSIKRKNRGLWSSVILGAGSILYLYGLSILAEIFLAILKATLFLFCFFSTFLVFFDLIFDQRSQKFVNKGLPDKINITDSYDTFLDSYDTFCIQQEESCKAFFEGLPGFINDNSTFKFDKKLKYPYTAMFINDIYVPWFLNKDKFIDNLECLLFGSEMK